MPLAPRNRQLFCIGAGLVLAACASHSSAAPGDDAQACAPDVADHDSAVTHSYAVVHGWPELSEGFVLGQVSGVAIDSHRHVFVFHRADHPWLDAPGTTVITAPTLLRLSADTGRIEASLGAGMFVVPHGLRIDAHDHLWVTDVGLHQVFELDHDGTVLRSFGTAGVPGADATHFDQPTDVAVAPDGGFYVSDGYGNSRVVQFDKDGAFVRDWGEAGAGAGQLTTPHSIAIDAHGTLYVADRGNSRVQRFDSAGKLLGQWKSSALGRPWAVSITAKGDIFVVDGGDQNPLPPDRAHVLRVSSSGKVLESWSSYGNYDGQLFWGHAIAVSPDDEVFVGDIRGSRVQKFVRAK